MNETGQDPIPGGGETAILGEGETAATRCDNNAYATRDGLARLLSVTAALSRAMTREQVADVIMEHGLTAMDASRGVISLLSADATEFVNLRIGGYPDDVRQSWLRFPASLPMAIPDAVRLRQPIILETWEQRVQCYPKFHDKRTPGADGALVALPLLVQDEVIGALGLAFTDDRHFSPAELDLMLAIAGQCAQALERARLYDAERAARERAEREASERRKAQVELVEKEARFRLLFANHPHPMWVYDLETLRFLEVNEAAVAAYGYSRDEFLQLRITDIRPPHEVERLLASLQDPRPVMKLSGVWQHQARDGRIRYVEVTSHLLEFDGRKAVLVVAQDISDRKRLEDQLLQAQKLESVGRLAGGVAHDFNNLLAVITGHAEMAEEEMSADAPLYGHIRTILEAADRAANLTRQLLAFARKQVIEPRIVNLNALAQGMEKMLRRLIGENIELLTQFGPELGLVSVDPGQFEQILVNLVVNARDAMPEGGVLTIATADVTLDEHYAQHNPSVTAGQYVTLSVSDTGIGIDDAVKGQIFDPFFTTKEKGKGTGLGLATVYGIVKQSGGHIWVYSEKQHGTTFKIYIPRLMMGTVDVTSPEVSETRPRGTETILVVEDEPTLRALTVSALRKQGYSVLEATHGQEALRVAAATPGAIDLLVTDVIMPQMGGRALSQHLQELRTGLKTLFISGYTDDMIEHHGVLEAGVAFLQKPFTLAALAQKVRQVLDAPEQSAHENP